MAKYEQHFTEEELNNEKWLLYPKDPRYQVSSLGRVKGVRGTILSVHMINSGYLTTGIGDKGPVVIQRLVGFTFLADTYKEGYVIDHKDNNRLNNRVENLHWVTFQENIDDLVARTPDMTVKARKKLAKTSLKPVNQYDKDWNLVASYPSIKEAEVKLGINTAHISDVCNGKRATTGGYHWQFANPDDLGRDRMKKRKAKWRGTGLTKEEALEKKWQKAPYVDQYTLEGKFVKRYFNKKDVIANNESYTLAGLNTYLYGKKRHRYSHYKGYTWELVPKDSVK